MKLRKITMILSIILIAVFLLGGCNEGKDLLPNKIKRVSGDYIYEKFYETESTSAHARIVGLSEQGKTKKVLLIPETIDNLPVEYLGYRLVYEMVGEFDSDVLEKVYLTKQYQSNKVIFGDKCTKLRAIIAINSKVYLSFTQNRFCVKMSLPVSEARKFWSFESFEICCNVVYYLNDGSDTVYFADDLDGETIMFLPPEPTREGYAFGGWYKESECITAWDFEKDAVSAKEYDEEGGYLFKETSLYAKWNKKNY